MLNVTPKVSKRLPWEKEGIWLPHKLSENAILNCLSIATSDQQSVSMPERNIHGEKPCSAFGGTRSGILSK